MQRDKVILAYSGGLDTSVMVPWIKENYKLDVVTFTVDLGQGDDLEGIKQKALRTGAVIPHDQVAAHFDQIAGALTLE